MRNVTFACVLLVAGVAGAQGQKSKAAVEGAKAAMDKALEAFNAHDAKALTAMNDKTYFSAGPTVSAKFDSPEANATEIEKVLAHGGRLSLDGITLKADDDANSVWFIADLTFIPKVPPGALPVHRKMRESGVMVRRGKEWKFAMTHLSVVQPDENAPVAPSTAAPVKK